MTAVHGQIGPKSRLVTYPQGLSSTCGDVCKQEKRQARAAEAESARREAEEAERCQAEELKRREAERMQSQQATERRSPPAYPTHKVVTYLCDCVLPSTHT